MKRSGTADLPPHGGRVPPWLAERMTKLGTAIAESVVYEYGASGAAVPTSLLQSAANSLSCSAQLMMVKRLGCPALIAPGVER
ncbi:MAG: DUF763 domain-containing protein [Terriglobales bacterium]